MKNLLKSLFLILFSAINTYSIDAANDLKLNNNTNHPVAPLHLSGNNKEESNGIKGKVMISALVGLNALRTSLNIQYEMAVDTYTNTPSITHASQVPMLSLGVDYGIGKKVSIGVAVGYQKVTLVSAYAEGGGYEYYDPNTGDIIPGGDQTDVWTKVHIAVRGDYYIIAKDKISLYTGFKLGYNSFNVTSTATIVDPNISNDDPNYISNITSYVKPSVVAAQAHFGFSYYFGSRVGFNTEVGLAYGGPYVFAAGLAIKI